MGPCESALDIAEHFRLQKVIGQRGAVDLHKWVVGAAARRVHNLGQEVFAGTGGALDQDGRIGSGNDSYHLEDFLHLGAFTDHIMESVAVPYGPV